jgi:hypothetical protein
MKTRLVIIMGLIGLAVAIGAGPARSDSTAAEQQKSYYLDCITNEIDACSCKLELVTSRSDNLREYGVEAARKAAFLTKNRDALVEEMVLRNVSMRPHAVHQYLLRRFNEENDIRMAVNVE